MRGTHLRIMVLNHFLRKSCVPPSSGLCWWNSGSVIWCLMVLLRSCFANSIVLGLLIKPSNVQDSGIGNSRQKSYECIFVCTLFIHPMCLCKICLIGKHLWIWVTIQRFSVSIPGIWRPCFTELFAMVHSISTVASGYMQSCTEL